MSEQAERAIFFRMYLTFNFRIKKNNGGADKIQAETEIKNSSKLCFTSNKEQPICTIIVIFEFALFLF